MAPFATFTRVDKMVWTAKRSRMSGECYISDDEAQFKSICTVTKQANDEELIARISKLPDLEKLALRLDSLINEDGTHLDDISLAELKSLLESVFRHIEVEDAT